MSTMRSKNPQTWWSNVDVLTGTNVLMHLGGPGGSQAVGDCLRRPYLRFGIYADQVLTLDIEVAQAVGGPWTVDQTLLTVANVWFHVYDLPAPRNRTGFYVLGSSYVRLRVTNASGTDTTVFEFTAEIRNEP